MDSEERSEIIEALNKAKEAFDKSLEHWNVRPPLRLEVREVRSGDNSLGESIVIDEITEHMEIAAREAAP